MERLEKTAEKLRQRRFQARCFETAEQAGEAVLEVLGSGSVGIGGSRTVEDMDLYEAIRAHGNQIVCHTLVPQGEKAAVRTKAMDADAYLCSANAITEEGLIVNIDGTGNRVAAMLFGPEKVIVVAGKNKIVKNVEEGILRTKRDCCPKNTRRLGKSTPCALTGECGNCTTPERSCNATVIWEYPTRNVREFYVFLVNEELGW